MASQSVGGQRWPEGTVVSAYPSAAWVNRAAAPTGAAVTTATVASGVASFSGLTAKAAYVAYAAGVGVQFTAPSPAGPVTAAPIGTRVDVLEEQLAATTVAVAAAGVPPLGQRLLQLLADDTRNVSFLILGDSTSVWSTSADNTKWMSLVLASLAARFPRFTVVHRTWNGSNSFQLVNTVQTGTGPNTLTLYNASQGNTGPRWILSAALDMMMFWDDFDLCIVNHGHNAGAGFAAETWRDELLALTESVSLRRPGMEVVLVAQNPRPGSDYQQAQSMETARAAMARGYGFVNVWRAFQDGSPGGVTVSDPAGGALVSSDNVHPNTAGYALWAATVTARLVREPGVIGSQQHSSLAVPVVNQAANGDFSSFAAPPTLPSWAATAATLSKDATNFESPAGWSVKLTPTGAAASYIAQVINLKWALAQHVVVAARVWASSAVKIASSSAARVSILEAGGSTPGETLSAVSPNGTDTWVWLVASRFIAVNATSVTIRCYGDSGSVSTSVVSFDRVIVARGILPRDLR